MVPLFIFGVIGPIFRREFPEGCTFFEYIQARFGTAMNIYCTVVSLFYLFIYLSAEFKAVGDCVVSLSQLDNPLGPVLATSLVTLAYTSIGGMPVSLVTDKVQGVCVLVLALVVCCAAFGFYEAPTSSEDPTVKANWEMVTSYGLADSAEKGFKMSFVLISAVTCAVMMHSGYQQRIWSAASDVAVWRGALGGALLTMPLMVLFGVIGMVAFAHLGIPGLVAVGPDSLYLAYLAAFFLVVKGGPFWQALAIILAVMMVASSADTVQTGAAALLKPVTTRVLDTVLPGASKNPKTVIGATLLITAALINIPAIALSTAEISVLSLLVLADLVCATAVVPMLLGLWPRFHPIAAIPGCFAGLATAIIVYAVSLPDAVTGEPENNDLDGNFVPMKMIVEAGGLYSETSFVAFIVVPLASGLVSLIVNVPYYRQGYQFAFKKSGGPPDEAKGDGQSKSAADEGGPPDEAKGDGQSKSAAIEADACI